MTDQQEGYTYPGTHVLKNKAELRDLAELQRFERGATAIRIQELRENPVKGNYDLVHLQAIHRQVFKDVYEWAGEVRTVDIAKGPAGDRTLFTFKEDIPAKAAEVAATIKEAGYLRGTDKAQFADKMAEVYAGLNEMHPSARVMDGRRASFLGSLPRKAATTSITARSTNKSGTRPPNSLYEAILPRCVRCSTKSRRLNAPRLSRNCPGARRWPNIPSWTAPTRCSRMRSGPART
ncbi:protein of unknown function (plasmid) [Denitratisoma oestradiolicum]|uniref:protein adenylyltransferase n=1 Tax=Denitratisoma oestradiolicum TaxID=311182 RepID=A0A6S6Y1I5_9PROT|nr:protein of unknown function [Denitratisoma oestradiolicum]